jgi:hypothetical protein
MIIGEAMIGSVKKTAEQKADQDKRHVVIRQRHGKSTSPFALAT